MLGLSLNELNLDALRSNPLQKTNGNFFGYRCTTSFVIPNYFQQLRSFYQSGSISDIRLVEQQSGIACNFKHFGLLVEFEQATELSLHNKELDLSQEIKSLIHEFGLIIIKNAYLNDSIRDIGHKNRFPDLKFHYDRSAAQKTVYSLYTRNPFDEEQRLPRTSSTLFIPNLVVNLQLIKEGKKTNNQGQILSSNYDLFLQEDMSAVINHIAAEHSWDEPENTGEISIIDNRTVMHASYYKGKNHPGYRIGVRYCS